MSYHYKAGRSEKQIQNMKELTEKGICFMCYENIKEYENNRIEFETKNWLVTPNAYPYDHTSLHLLLIPKVHVKTVSELSPESRAELTELVVEVEKRYKLDTYAYCMRSGDMRYNGGSVEHLHAHIIVGQKDPEKFEKVRFKVASHPDK